ncbi:MAG: TonB-dependent receptor [Steroidobacteraceae bacterium]
MPQSSSKPNPLRFVLRPARPLALFSAFAACVAPFAAWSEDSSELAEVVVTAQRREETLQKVPASISVFSGEKLEAANVKDVRGYFMQTPNVTFQEDGKSGPRSVDIAMRGISNIGGRVNAFGIYLDGFNIANGSQEGAVNPTFEDIERVEVLRGPQGTFFGRNATGGALNITTKAPGPEFEGQLKSHYGSYGTWGMTGVVNAPVVDDKFFVRAMVNYEESDGFVRNMNPAGGRSDFQLTNMKLAGRWLLNDRLTMDLAVYATREESGLSPLIPTGVLSADTASIVGTTIPVTDGLPFYPANTNRVNHDQPLDQNNEMNMGNLRLRYAGDGFEIHSITGYMDTRRKYMDDLDFTSQPLLTQKIDDTTRSWSEELRVQSTGDGPWVWTVGALYAEDAGDVLHEVRAGTGGFFGLPNAFPIDIVVEDTRAKSWAVFAQTTWHATDRLALTAGGRYSDDSLEQTSAGIGFGTPKQNNRGEVSFSDFSPRFSASFDLTDDLTTYATASKGYKAGGLQFNAALPEQFFDKEELWNYELGLRSYWLDHRLMLNATVFQMEWKDLQVESTATVVDPVTNAIIVIDATLNAASATSKGAELELSARPTQSWLLDAAVGYLDAKFDRFPDALVSGNQVDLSGYRVIRSPKWTLSANAQYEFPLSERISADTTGYVRGEWSYRSSTKPNMASILQSGFPYEVDAFQVVNLRAGVRNDAWSLEGYLENALDEEYFTGHALFGFGGVRVRPHPRLWGVRVAFNFN